jgi:hypothetical protein
MPEEIRRGERVRDRFGLLLGLLVAAFVAQAFEASTLGRVVAAALTMGVVLVGVLVTGARLFHRWVVVLVALGAFGVVLGAAADQRTVSFGIGSVFSGLVLASVLVAVLDRVLRHRRVTIETLMGAVCAYFLIGLIFSSAYGVLDGFGSQPLFGSQQPRSVYSYFSFVTLTTVGFGDYTAKTDLGRRIVVIEAVFGQVFLATTLARLVSLFSGPREIAAEAAAGTAGEGEAPPDGPGPVEASP